MGEKNTINSDMKVIRDLLKEVEQNKNEYQSYISEHFLSTYGIEPSVFEDILPYNLNFIETIKTDDFARGELLSFLSAHIDQELPIGRETLDLITNDTEKLYDIVKEVKDSSLSLFRFHVQSKELVENSKEVINQYHEYMNSEEVANARRERLEIMKRTIAIEQDPEKRAALERSIRPIEACMDLSYVFDRINVVGKKEIKAIMDTALDDTKGSYVLKKYRSKNEKFGISDKFHTCLFNIEENFLPEKYHVYNNLFLAGFIRFVAYADPYNNEDVMYVKTLASNLSYLIYHKYTSEEDKQKFIDIITRFIDCFSDYYEVFNTKNRTHPNHPYRIEADKRHDERRREIILKKMKNLNITDYDENMSTDDLYDFLSERVDKLISEQLPPEETELEESIVDVDENGVVEIKPNLPEHTVEQLSTINDDIEVVGEITTEVEVQ